MSNSLAKILTILLIASVAWGTAFALVGFWLFGASIATAWIIALSVLVGMLSILVMMGIEFYRSFDPNELKDDEGNEFLEAIMLGAERF